MKKNKGMTYKQFVSWCEKMADNDRLGLQEAMICMGIMYEVERQPFWKREKVWRVRYRDRVINTIFDRYE